MKVTSVADFYRETSGLILPEISQEIGHFNIFDVRETVARFKKTKAMPYNRRSYYKISLVNGRNKAEYANKVFDIEKNTLLFATPKVPYHWLPQDDNQSGFFCIFTDDFLLKNKSGAALDDLPIFKPNGFPVFFLTDEEAAEIEQIFLKMKREIASNYAYKYDLLRNLVLELIHFGQKLQPATASNPTQNASARIASLFIELLERQFPIETPQQTLRLRTAKDFAENLSVHVNHLNKVLKENTGKTTTELINERLAQEAKILLKLTNWNVSQISDSLGFEEVAHFSNFFKKQTSKSPAVFRTMV